MTIFVKRIVSSAVAMALVLAAGFSVAGEKKDIVDTAVEAGSFKTLAAALDAADLVDALKGKGPFTVFAPTDEAFAKLPAGTVESLLKPENKAKLQAILKYHVVAGRVTSKDALAAKKATTLQGGQVKISVQDGKAKVNGANLIKTDIEASNGVIHVIDSVLLPGKKSRLSKADARKMIEHAVARGARTYNAGHHDACAKIYMTTMTELVQHSDQMPEQVVTQIKHVMATAHATTCPTERSWTLRRGLDHVYAAMSN